MPSSYSEAVFKAHGPVRECSSVLSSLDPALIEIEIAIDSELGMLWVIKRKPESNTDFSCLIKETETLFY